MAPRFHAGACIDLGALDPTLADCGVATFVARSEGTLDWVVVMEDRQPVFFHSYLGYDADAVVPLNRHGPGSHAWKHADLRRAIAAFHEHGVKVLFGYWLHECAFVDERHPELVIRDAQGDLWQDFTEMNADFSPLRRMRADPEHDVREGERYSSWAVRRYARLARDFGFDGLFLGDGGMGFRRHGHDWKDLRHFDYHEDWLAEFVADHAFDHHEGCTLAKDAPIPQKAEDVQAYHWEHWVEFNTARWTDYYRVTAEGVHATGGVLAAYNVMNYDPALARQHGVDYRAIAEAGLDLLVFQAYDYAWGPLGPFGFLNIQHKDLETNLQALLRTRAHVGFETGMQIVITVETEDEVERWNAPVPHTLGELYHYGHALAHDGISWRRAADGAFIVWGNSVQPPEWRALAAAFDALSAPPHAPTDALVWHHGEIAKTVRAGVPRSTEAADLYRHLAQTVGVPAILTPETAQAARMPDARRRARSPPRT